MGHLGPEGEPECPQDLNEEPRRSRQDSGGEPARPRMTVTRTVTETLAANTAQQDSDGDCSHDSDGE